MLSHDHLGSLTLHGRRYSVRDNTSLIAAFSSDNSAYMGLSLAFSTSSFFIRFSSLTGAPPYFDRHLKYEVRCAANNAVLRHRLRNRYADLPFLQIVANCE